MYKNVKNQKELIPEFRKEQCPNCPAFGLMCQEQSDSHILACPRFFNYKLVGRVKYYDWQ